MFLWGFEGLAVAKDVSAWDSMLSQILLSLHCKQSQSTMLKHAIDNRGRTLQELINCFHLNLTHGGIHQLMGSSWLLTLLVISEYKYLPKIA